MASKRNSTIDPASLELTEQVVHINRTTKVVKGGKNLSFSALVVVGDGNGHVGWGMGKAREVPTAIAKGIERARRNVIRVARDGSTIPHASLGHFGSGRVVLRPAAAGTGVIAGGAVRSVLAAAGIGDILTKCIGSRNPHVLVKAALAGLAGLQTVEQIAARRGKDALDSHGAGALMSAPSGGGKDASGGATTGGRIRVTLVKGWAGKRMTQRRVLHALGLRRTGDSRVLPDVPSVRGAVVKVTHLVRVDPAEDI